MKKLMVLISFLCAFNLKAETYERTLVKGYRLVPKMDYSFEIKTSKYDKVILDCQSFVTGINFYKNKKLVHGIYLDAYSDCPDLHSYITDSLAQKLPICLTIETESNTLTVSNESDCQ
jgi:hypothetical protein